MSLWASRPSPAPQDPIHGSSEQPNHHCWGQLLPSCPFPPPTPTQTLHPIKEGPRATAFFLHAAHAPPASLRRQCRQRRPRQRGVRPQAATCRHGCSAASPQLSPSKGSRRHPPPLWGPSMPSLNPVPHGARTPPRTAPPLAASLALAVAAPPTPDARQERLPSAPSTWTVQRPPYMVSAASPVSCRRPYRCSNARRAVWCAATTRGSVRRRSPTTRRTGSATTKAAREIRPRRCCRQAGRNRSPSSTRTARRGQVDHPESTRWRGP